MYYLLIVSLLLLAATAPADELNVDDIKRLHDAGNIVSLETILEDFRSRYRAGRVLETELDKRDGGYIYELEILDKDGEVHELYYDARSGELLFYEIYLADPKTGVIRSVEIDARSGEILQIEQED